MFSLRSNTIKRILDHTTLLHSLGLILCAALFSSCTEELNIEIKANDKRLLVDGELTSDSVVHTIRLYCSGSLSTGQPQTVVTGAKIFVTDGIDTFEYLENNDSLGVYQTAGTVGGKGGRLYTLSITNIDIDEDGTMDSYTAQSLMPVPVNFDSLVSFYGMNGDRVEGTVINHGYYTSLYNGPDYLYVYVMVNQKIYSPLTDRLGTGELTSHELQFKTEKVNAPGVQANGYAYYAMVPNYINVKKGDTLSIVGLNFNQSQYEFLKEFDIRTNSRDRFNSATIYDQLKVPANLPTNIEPADKAAGYFFVYSISKISKVFKP